MNILVSGSSGLVGKHLLPLLRASGHAVTRLVRREARSADEIGWNPAKGRLDGSAFDGIRCVINLSGDNIGKGRWSAEKKRRILDSRVETTGLLANTMAAASSRPETFISVSAIGCYGHRGEELLTETSELGCGFLVDVCQQWEAAANPAAAAGIRVVHPRFGMILSPEDGALAAMLTPFKLGVGGNMGNGRQYWSWLTVAEAVRILLFAVTNEQLCGPVNAVAPHPVTNAEFTKALARVLKRPAFLPMPAFAARLLLGEMADSLILSSARVLPRRLEEAGYEFLHPELESALRDILRK